MARTITRILALSTALTLPLGILPAQADSDQEERIRQLEQQVEALTRMIQGKGESAEPSPQEEKVRELEEQVEALTEEVEESGNRESRWDRVHFGSYGELHYNNLSADDPSNDLKEIDLHRFVLEFGYDFTDRLRFFSEVEFEHDGSEVEVEQAYIQYDITQNQDILGGVFLLPIGILNPTHEPTTFYGVERNDVENIIIPTTWWAGGALYEWRFGQGFAWDVALHEGLFMSDDYRVRSGRQKTDEAVINDGAMTTSLKWTGYPGLELGAAFQYQINPGQGETPGLDDGYLLEAHAIYQYRMFGLRALYGRWDFSGDGIEAAGADIQQGWYVEPSVKWWSERFAPHLKDRLGFYFRYEDIPNAARVQDMFDQWSVGFNYWPIPEVVLKFDYRDRSHKEAAARGYDFTGFDLGLGYAF